LLVSITERYKKHVAENVIKELKLPDMSNIPSASTPFIREDQAMIGW